MGPDIVANLACNAHSITRVIAAEVAVLKTIFETVAEIGVISFHISFDARADNQNSVYKKDSTKGINIKAINIM